MFFVLVCSVTGEGRRRSTTSIDLIIHSNIIPLGMYSVSHVTSEFSTGERRIIAPVATPGHVPASRFTLIGKQCTYLGYGIICSTLILFLGTSALPW